MKTALLRLLLVFAILATTLGSTAVAAQVSKPGETSEHGIQIEDMDLDVVPGDDFYSFANGGWMDRTELPGGLPRFGASNEVTYMVGEVLYRLIEEFEADPDTPEGKARLYFDQFIDTDTRNEQGLDPVQPLLDEILAISSIEDGLVFQEASDSSSLVGLFAPFAAAAPDDATLTAAWLYGPQLSLPSEDYYLDDSDDGQEIRDAWVATTTELLIELGYDEEEAASAAEIVIAFETALAEAKTPDQILSTDPTSHNSPRTLEELSEILPSFDWEAFVERSDLPDDVDTIYVYDIGYLEALNDVLAEADPLTLQYLFATQLVWEFSDLLTTDIEDIAFSFEGPVLLGVSEQIHPEDRALSTVTEAFPDTFGEHYVDEAFSPEAKAEVEALVDHLIAAFRIRIEESTWMSDETKLKAIEKLDLMSVLVGYPETWATYDNVTVGDSLFETAASVYDASNEVSLGAVGQPVDRTEWPMSAFEVNAAYVPSTNTIVFPAGILQAPYFDPEADLASNYGAIGAIIGHEITHGFDISGSQYDGYGNLVSWWTQEDFDAFSELNAGVIDQYSQIEVADGLFVDGELTVTENVADMGGLQVAWDGLQLALEESGETKVLSQQQRFFIAWSQAWRSVSTPEYLEYAVATDEHAPAVVRAVQPARNMDVFYEAFEISEGDPEYIEPGDRYIIW